MMIDVEVRHITPVDGNVFCDLGFEDEEAEQLLKEADRLIEIKRANNAQVCSKWKYANFRRKKSHLKIQAMKQHRMIV